MKRRQIFVTLALLLFLTACEKTSKNSAGNKGSEYGTAFIEQTECGVYSLQDDFSWKIFLFDENLCQFICSGKSSELFYKMLDFQHSAYLHIDFASEVSSLEENSTVRADMESAGIEALTACNGQAALEVVKVSGKLCYLRDNVKNIGYIIFQ